jgi:7-cyano-7-deazaguanine synthase
MSISVDIDLDKDYMNKQKYAVISLSGGMDSSTLLLNLLANDYQVTALSFDYGQKHKVELERATQLVEYINDNRQCGPEADQFWYSLVKHQIIKIDGLGQLLNSTLVEGGADVPEGHYAEENMKSTVVPNRNKIFSSIIQAVALSITEQNKSKCVIALGVHSGDHQIYPDCTPEWRDIDFEAFKVGNWGAEKVHFFTPYMDGNKFSILKDGVKCCNKLGLDFDEVYKRTNTSYKPIWIGEFDSMNNPSEKTGWYSDYKSASSVERVEAFIKLGRPDPVPYADETGPVSWEHVKAEVTKVLVQNSNMVSAGHGAC